MHDGLNGCHMEPSIHTCRAQLPEKSNIPVLLRRHRDTEQETVLTRQQQTKSVESVQLQLSPEIEDSSKRLVDHDLRRRRNPCQKRGSSRNRTAWMTTRGSAMPSIPIAISPAKVMYPSICSKTRNHEKPEPPHRRSARNRTAIRPNQLGFALPGASEVRREHTHVRP